MHPVQRVVELWVVRALVSAAALPAREARGRDQAGEGKWILEYPPEAVGIPPEPGVPPERSARLLGRHLRVRLGSQTRRRGRFRIVAGGERGPPPEYEALGERVRRQPVCAVQPGASRF